VKEWTVNIDTTFEEIVDCLDMFWCPRCMAVAYGREAQHWTFGITNEAFDSIDCVCPDCVTEADLTNPEVQRWINQR
jgi:hypothetical protein